MSQRTKVVGARTPILWLLIAISLIVVAVLAIGGLVVYPQFQRQQAEQTRQVEAERHYQAGVAFQNASDWTAAEGEFKQVIVIDANYKDVQVRLAQVKAQLAGVGSAATSVAQATLVAAPTDTAQALEAHYQKGLGYMNMGRWQEAKAELEQVFAVNPNYKEVQAKLREVEAEVAKLTPTTTPTPRVTATPTRKPTPLYLYTDGSWLTFHRESPGWQTVDFNDSIWVPSLIVTNQDWGRLQGMDPTAQWIWNPNASVNVPIFFRKKFSLSALPTSAVLRISGDNAYKVYVNSNFVGEDTGQNDSWLQAESYIVTPYLALDSNVIAVQVIDFGVVGGLIASLTIGY